MSDISAFQLLHDGLRRQIYKMGWSELRPMQVDAIRCVLRTDHHVILSAGTASGKTEAAFLPVLSAIADEPDGSVKAIYVGPLKALINDQFGRLEELCNNLDLPVFRWHGDIGATSKAKLISNPGGVLLITPESLESLFVNRSRFLSKLFGGLRFVVIDELHSFLENERGLHLRSLLYRVASRTEKPLRLIGLSATIGEPESAKIYLDRANPEKVQLIFGDQSEPELRVRLHAYSATRSEQADDEKSDPPSYACEMAGDIVDHCRGSTNLIFANSRNAVEYYGDLCQRLAAVDGLPDRFLVHHGSLSADLRHETEETMKESSHSGRPVTTFCSTTLEMGIDIGNVRTVGQIGAPHAVSSLKQRVGRSGRRAATARILRGYLECKAVDDRPDLFDRLHLPLIQNIAIIELLMQRWVEAAEPSTFDLSTLTQQIISIISETGGVRANYAYDVLCRNGAFRDVQSSEFVALLRQLHAVDVVEQTPEGDLILGLFGEDIRKDKGFYAVFMTGDAYTVLCDGEKIGAVDSPPEIKQHMILGGRRWEVTAVDDRQRIIYVVPGSGRKSAPFAGDGGRILHPRVVSEMHMVLQSSKSYTYLSPLANQLLTDARRVAAATAFCSKSLIAVDMNQTAFLPWVGSRTLSTMQAMFKAKGVDALVEEGMALVLPKSLEASLTVLSGMLQQPPPIPDVLRALTGCPKRKYDELLNEQLLFEIQKRRWLDVPSAMAALKNMNSVDHPESAGLASQKSPG